jgi:hypothetical protein
MRTAEATFVLTGRTRPRSCEAIDAATAELDNIAGGRQRISPVRFVGYQPNQHRAAIYQADYDHD